MNWTFRKQKLCRERQVINNKQYGTYEHRLEYANKHVNVLPVYYAYVRYYWSYSEVFHESSNIKLVSLRTLLKQTI